MATRLGVGQHELLEWLAAKHRAGDALTRGHTSGRRWRFDDEQIDQLQAAWAADHPPGKIPWWSLAIDLVPYLAAGLTSVVAAVVLADARTPPKTFYDVLAALLSATMVVLVSSPVFRGSSFARVEVPTRLQRLNLGLSRLVWFTVLGAMAWGLIIAVGIIILPEDQAATRSAPEDVLLLISPFLSAMVAILAREVIRAWRSD